MNDKQAFLNAIIESPDDNGLRLIYSDFLDENGEPEQAELIRVQIQLLPLRPRPKACQASGHAHCQYCQEIRVLEDRERVLTDYLYYFRGTDNLEFTYRCGLPERLRCTAQDWETNAAAILKECPLREVELVTLPEVRNIALTIHPVAYRYDIKVNGEWVRFISLDECYDAWESKWPRIKFTRLPSPRLVTIPNELLRFVSPSIEQQVREDVVAALSRHLEDQLGVFSFDGNGLPVYTPND